MNVVAIVGRIGADCETRYFESGKAIAEFRIAVDNGKDKPPFWFSIKYWLKEGSKIQDYLLKGAQVAVSGQLIQETWVSQDGANRSKVVIQAQRIDLLGSKADDRRPDTPATGTPSPAYAGEPTGPGWEGGPDF